MPQLSRYTRRRARALLRIERHWTGASERRSLDQPMPSLFLVVLARDLDPQQVSDVLGLRASQWWRRGEKKTYNSDRRKRPPLTRVHEWSGWKHYFESPKTERTLIRKITKIATGFSARKSRLHALIKDGHELHFVSLLQDASCIVIPPELHRLLGGLGIHLRIDFWPPDKE